VKNRSVRIALVVLALAAQAAAGFFVYRAEQALASARADAAALAGVVSSQAAAADREAARLRPREGLALAGAAVLTLVALLLLLPRTNRDTTPAEAESPAPGLALPLVMPSTDDLNSLGRSGFDLDIRRPAAPPTTEPLSEPPRESEEAIVDDLKRETALRMNTEAQVDLAATARLCSDLARVKDAGQLPALLARAAELLDAAGIVLWLAGPEGTVLRPAASVGYRDHTLSRMKALSGRSDNAVSVAFREGRMEVVGGTKERNGAVVVPIVTVGGRTGAMAAEIRHGAESSPSVQAVATIIAAQLASLVADTTTA
jgi:hypothetical protein